jgi:hypothetical protein
MVTECDEAVAINDQQAPITKESTIKDRQNLQLID